MLEATNPSSFEDQGPQRLHNLSKATGLLVTEVETTTVVSTVLVTPASPCGVERHPLPWVVVSGGQQPALLLLGWEGVS